MARRIKTLENTRLDTIEAWISEKQTELSDFRLLENFTFLINTVREYSDGVQRLRTEAESLKRNQLILEEYMLEIEHTEAFSEWLKKKQEAEENAQKEDEEKDESD